ncbi:hypothetical protein AXY43_20190 [Clostridium sp. MF28]|uniref:flippase n=1 Tax=Clostridium TaxID=1485 RepID=UPI000CF96072|nr:MULTISPECIES: flippase [Clostridium]AVK50122.1 hypothetical protein AXY43_20190 [Clostridium sp. MF28]PSM57642.1 hypothetical protein C4L39_11685 [Clostridium diolis]
MKSLKKNAVLNIVKQICQVLFPLITVPYVSRVLSAENYGRYNFANSIISYFSLIAALGITNYAIREGARVRDNKEEFEKFSSEIFTINCWSTMVSYFFLFGILIVSEKLHSYTMLILIQSLVILFTTAGVDWINSIYEEFTYITIRYIIIQCLSVVAMLMIVHNESDYILYALITVCANAGANLMNIIHVRKYVKLRFTFKPNLKKHMLPMLLLFCNTIAVTIYVNSDATMLGILVSDQAVGIYSLVAKVYTIVKQLLSAILIVTLPRFSVYLGNNDIDKYNCLLKKVFNALISILLPAIVGLFMLSEHIINILGGTEYQDGYIALKILSIGLMFAILAYFYSGCILLPYKKEKNFLIATIMGALANIVINFIVIPRYSYIGASSTTVLAELIVFAFCWYYSRKLVQVKFDRKVLLSVGISCIAIIIICHFTTIKLGVGILPGIVSIALSGISYLLIMLLFKNEIVMQFIRSIKEKVM